MLNLYFVQRKWIRKERGGSSRRRAGERLRAGADGSRNENWKVE